MKNIAIFCDGTWNNRDKTDSPTSVARLEEIVDVAKDNDGNGQKSHYQIGLGANDDVEGAAKFLDKFRGGALGRGLTQDLRECYEFLIETYAPGDRIFIFGFSRGAYTARSFAGLIRAAGIPEEKKHIGAAMAWYRNRHKDTHPNSDASHQLRAQISPRVFTSNKERDWRTAQFMDTGQPVDIGYLGIFDTVGAHGIPGVLGQFRAVPGGHGFHDHDLSSLVRSGRHAMGLDETRVLYRPTKWSNLDELNRVLGKDDEGGLRYRQLWFPGDHGKIGGSGSERRISNSVLEWIVEGARVAGLGAPLTSEVEAKADDYLGSLTNGGGFDPTGLIRWTRRGPGAGETDELHDVAKRRIVEVSSYRPGSLRRMLLDQASLADLQQEHATRFA
ncbi:MAG: DUF2235 domain-containing protein [Pseudomonadota bacterium]